MLARMTSLLACTLLISAMPALSLAGEMMDNSSMSCQQMMDKGKPMMDQMSDMSKKEMAKKEMDSAKMAMDHGKMDDCKMHMSKAMDMMHDKGMNER